ncbi:phosphatidylserine decarboxylase [Flavobacterium branchiophilum NBRC 15030 = ATCC 35035]|uniref:Acyl-CoA-binding protein n=2 Tax=Flavobacterium branchiophilum TaxID=55197 RepID=A0A2H3KET6_9FLAO|nr:acyl-CoA-binding protein [Flavobacterium branchiophilum]OXA70896.1 phosphatidylserine decarboxylase [Flavobacterium branchiophilum NBRC 15030 = ATCC 35035]PDS26865.1 phosphatidylserine decarboxylase [Flavobacterium branchiophilum]TQM42069.1 acyl-CoA-binding protein [Flavobacterium branchiophilum]CCB69620.1 Probable Acyl CoA binding protein [Flavobacterium branchiophilum FL-15]GEM53840.1 acyl-CoA-binding protein [Flavobacterium branchiophilum NBRC 15030 = ATCC 35035]
MLEKDLDIRFQEAVTIALTIPQSSLPQDVQLRLYAYYKQATLGTIESSKQMSFDLRNAFKTNAWMQISHLSVEEAKELYIASILSIKNKI